MMSQFLPKYDYKFILKFTDLYASIAVQGTASLPFIVLEFLGSFYSFKETLVSNLSRVVNQVICKGFKISITYSFMLSCNFNTYIDIKKYTYNMSLISVMTHDNYHHFDCQKSNKHVVDTRILKLLYVLLKMYTVIILIHTQ